MGYRILSSFIADCLSDAFDEYWRVASKITPSASAPVSTPPASAHTRPSTDTGSALDRDGAYSVRSIPVRVYLPDGPILQEFAPPLLEDGKTNTFQPSVPTKTIVRHTKYPLQLPVDPSVTPLSSSAASTTAFPSQAQPSATQRAPARLCVDSRSRHSTRG